MAEFMQSGVPAPPDLLKRFVPTPLCTRLRFGNTEILAQTHDSSILGVLHEYEGHLSGSHQRFVWTLVRDNVEAPLLQPTIIHHGHVTFVDMGPACLAAIDHETRELFAFLGANISVGTLRVDVLPLLFELTLGVSEAPEELPNSEFADMDSSNV